MNPLSVLSTLVTSHGDELEQRFGRNTRAAFEEMHDRGRELTEKQETWVMDIAEKMGIVTAPGANLFSRLSPEERRRQREAAKRIKLPWER